MINYDPKGIYRLLYLGVLTSIILGILYYAVFAVSPRQVVGSDFISYLTGGQIIRQGEGRKIYDIKTQTRNQMDLIAPRSRGTVLPFKGPPFLGLFFIPLTFFSFIVGFRLFAIFNIFLLLLFTLCSGRFFKKVKKFDFWFLIPFLSISGISVITQGQVSFVLSFLVLFLYLSIKSKRYFLSGFFAGLLLLKPQYIVAAPFFFLLVKDKKSYIFGFASSFLLLVLTSVYISGLSTLLSYPNFLLSTETPVYGSYIQHMFTLNSTLFSFPFISSLGYQYLLALTGVLYLATLYFFAKRQAFVRTEYSFIAAILFTLLFAAHVLLHDLSILFVAIFILLNEAGRKGALRNWLILVAVLIFLLPFIIELIAPVLGTFVGLAISIVMISAVPAPSGIKNAR